MSFCKRVCRKAGVTEFENGIENVGRNGLAVYNEAASIHFVFCKKIQLMDGREKKEDIAEDG